MLELQPLTGRDFLLDVFVALLERKAGCAWCAHEIQTSKISLSALWCTIVNRQGAEAGV